VLIRRIESAVSADVTLGPIAAGDVLRLTVGELTEAWGESVKHVTVGAGGEVAVPLIGRVKVAGLTEAQATAAIVKAYRDRNVMNSALVTVLKVNPATRLSDGPASAE
jgi:protein involved in polysaccharide export with SLBB domain